jgi:hypothetical protein
MEDATIYIKKEIFQDAHIYSCMEATIRCKGATMTGHVKS